jgi:hypothetical protein
MPDGRVVALVVLVLGLLAVGAYFYVDYVRNRRASLRGVRREAEPLPLFGTEGLMATRALGGPPPRRPQTPAEGMGVAGATIAGGPGSGNGAGGGNGNGGSNGGYRPAPPGNGIRGGSPFAPPAPWSGGVPPQPVSAPALAATDTHRAITAAGLPPHSGAHRIPSGLDGPLHDGETLRFSIPEDGTLQFLPGRLEVVAGPDAGREVRFVRVPGERAEVTFGRSEGPAYRHVQLLARTVSRNHALMTLEDDHWSLRNMSSTNPVVLNGRPLAPDEIAPLLVTGDRIEMGEVVFLFHER